MVLTLGQAPSGSVIALSEPENPHVFISGQSGVGKSFLLKHLAQQAANQGSLVLVFDYTGDFHDYDPPRDLRSCRADITSSAFSLNLLSCSPGQSPDVRAQQLLAAIHSVFRIGPRATVALRQATAAYLTDTALPTLNGLLAAVDEIESKGKGLEAAQEPLALLASLVHCGNRPISLDLDTPGLVIVDFSKILDKNLCKLLVELILQTLWTTHTPEQPPLILVLDECQNLNWGANSMSIRILREGRKFGIGGWFSSQWIDNKEASVALGQAALQAHFRPDDQHVNSLAKTLCAACPSELPRYRQLIQSLRRGEFLWQSPGGKCVRVKVPK